MPVIPDHDWEHSVYGKYEEDIVQDVPEPLGNRIVLTHFFDAKENDLLEFDGWNTLKRLADRSKLTERLVK